MANIAVVPGLIDDAGDIAFILRVAQDKAIFCTVGGEPRKGIGVFKAIIQRHIAGGDDISSQPQIMFTGTWQSDNGFGDVVGVRIIVAFGFVLIDFAIEQADLIIVGAVG